jgi:hypothetical protein
MAYHAKLSASSAERWMNCAGSVNLSAGKAAPPTSRAAAEGTLAHNLAADYLKTGKQPFHTATQLGAIFKVDGHAIEFDEEMWGSIVEYVGYATLIKRKEWWVEMDLHEALKQWDPDLGGTADFVTYDPKTRWLGVVDYKHGAGVFVDADDNRQLKTYALGAMLTIGKPVDTVEVSIVQPRFEGADPVRSVSFPAYELIEFAGDLRQCAESTRQPDAPVVAGPWCKKTFCPHAAYCPELERMQHMLVKAEATAVVWYDPKQLSEAMQAIPLVKERIKAIEEEAYRRVTAGESIPGYKLVDKRPRRYWTDQKAVLAWAKARKIDPFEEPEMKSPAKLEKSTNAAGKRELAEFTATVSSGTTLVPESDNRKAVTNAITVDDFPALDGPKDTPPATIENIFE